MMFKALTVVYQLMVTFVSILQEMAKGAKPMVIDSRAYFGVQVTKMLHAQAVYTEFIYGLTWHTRGKSNVILPFAGKSFPAMLFYFQFLQQKTEPGFLLSSPPTSDSQFSGYQHPFSGYRHPSYAQDLSVRCLFAVLQRPFCLRRFGRFVL